MSENPKAKIDPHSMVIMPLSEANIGKATALIRKELAEQIALLGYNEGPEVCFKHALNKQTPEAQNWARDNGIVLERLQYFLAVDKSTGEMLGFSGIYSTSEGYLNRTAVLNGWQQPDRQIASEVESNNTFCMGWSAVVDGAKGMGVGSVLMAHGMKLAAEIAEREGIEKPKWGVISDRNPDTVAFYTKRGLTQVMMHGVEPVFLDNLAKARELFAKYEISNFPSANPTDKKDAGTLAAAKGAAVVPAPARA